MNLKLQHNGTLKNINGRPESHGDEKVPVMDFDIVINDLNCEELDQLALDGEHYSDAFWRVEDGDDGVRFSEPRFGLLSNVAIDLKLEEHEAVIAMESADKLTVDQRGECVFTTPVKVKKIKFSPKSHGLCDLSLQIQGEMDAENIGRAYTRYQGERIQLKLEPMNGSLLDVDEDSEPDQE